ncbi:hypothetical protein RND81_03G025500 [Saponaria officinalis]|uniref:Uncharacterized protein n=1 Tax=Saponaria officinalis TaxID=3572 RepID=A0AAW1LXY6_SAPOF
MTYSKHDTRKFAIQPSPINKSTSRQKLWETSNLEELGRREEKMGGVCSCFDGETKEEKKEANRLASEEARAKAAEAAQRRQEEFEKSAIGRAARAQMTKEKQSASYSKGEPALKWQMG